MTNSFESLAYLPSLSDQLLQHCLHGTSLAKRLYLYHWWSTNRFTVKSTEQLWCQTPVFLLGVSQHRHKITNCEHFRLNWSSNLQENNERKNILVAQNFVCFQMPNKRLIEVCSLLIFEWEIASQREPYLTLFYTINSSSLLNTK